MGKYLNDAGTRILAEKIKTKIEITNQLPEETPYFGYTMLYVGNEVTDNYYTFRKGHIYTFVEESGNPIWKEIEVVDGIARSVATVATAVAHSVETSVKNKISYTEEIPADPENGLVVFYNGESTDNNSGNFRPGCIYQYVESTGWVEIEISDGIARSVAGVASTMAQEALNRKASDIPYSDTSTSLGASNIQGAIEALNTKINSSSSGIIPRGTVAFANLPSLSNADVGDMYNISDDFTTTSDFMVTGIHEKAGSNVYCIDNGGTKKWDVFAVAPDIVIDSSMSDSSLNPVQNKVVKAYIDQQITASIQQVLNTGF